MTTTPGTKSGDDGACFACTEVKKNIARCTACAYVTCVECTKKYLLSTPKAAHCMNCKVAWTNGFMKSVFDKKWLTRTHAGSYREHRKTVAFNRERSKLPETLARVPEFKLEEEREKLRNELLASRAGFHTQIKHINSLLGSLSGERPQRTVGSGPGFVCPCPREKCRGMIARATSTCALCEQVVCRRCLAPTSKATDHECTAADLETVKLIRRDTKPCPQCATAIFKISGCDQMWCTQCRTPFSWRTGTIETGVVHNPHALRWEREHGTGERAAGDVPCGGLPPVRRLRRLPQSCFELILPIYQRLAEIPHLLASRFVHRSFDDLRKRYVLNQITEKNWKQAIFLRERSNERHRVQREICSTLQVLGVERFRQLAQDLSRVRRPRSAQGRQVCENFLDEMEKVRLFINETFQMELENLDAKPLCIPEEWPDFW